MTFKQLTSEQRYLIKGFLQVNQKKSKIADLIGVSRSTIYRELERNTGKRGYRPKQAHDKALSRRKGKQIIRISRDVWTEIENRIRKDHSPEQISGSLRADKEIQISHETIYQYVYRDKKKGGKLYKHLRCQKTYRKRTGSYDRRGKIRNRTCIDKRPEIVNTRGRLGDWEVDLILGKNHQGAMVTLTDRKSRFTLVRKVMTKHADLVAQTVVDLLKCVNHFHTITADNGKEFAKHEYISRHLNADVYFAHPYSSWERGTNENTNGLIRQYLPKSRNLKTVTPDEELMVMDRLNFRPRKCLAWKTPFQVLFEKEIVAFNT